MARRFEPLINRADGSFFCHGCLETLPGDYMSPDPKYCIECCEFLLAEYEKNYTGWWAIPEWVPKVSPVPANSPKAHCNKNLARKTNADGGTYSPVTIEGVAAGKNLLQRRLL